MLKSFGFILKMTDSYRGNLNSVDCIRAFTLGMKIVKRGPRTEARRLLGQEHAHLHTHLQLLVVWRQPAGYLFDRILPIPGLSWVLRCGLKIVLQNKETIAKTF